MERGFDGERRRRYDVHELYLLSVVFDVPIAYSFISPPGTGLTELADSRRPVAELWRSLLGTDSQLDAVDARVAETKIGDPEASDQVLAAIFGAENAATNWHTHFRTWRKQRLREFEVEYGGRFDEVAESCQQDQDPRPRRLPPLHLTPTRRSHRPRRRGGAAMTRGRRRQLGGIDRLPSGRWRARVLDPGTGRRVSTGTFPTKAAAERAFATAITDQQKGAWSRRRKDD